MDMTLGTGFMAVFAVSGSVVLLAHQFHKRLLSDFMKKMESEMGSEKNQAKKKVRFCDGGGVAGITSDVNEYVKELVPEGARESYDDGDGNGKCRKTMPLNWQVMYKGIMNYRNSNGIH